ncbi:hypothetical protein B0H14DRAFT_2819178 [Mycena olivaceomarginata]|nr:hypothetical protein B0H14DRAFT_2819178 [Mycena olivaceomarginata]
MSLPPAKRQRIENAPITRSEIWYSDGSVVLRAETSQFCVHWSVLAQHSSFFLDLQALLPQPESGQPTMDGCPLVELQDTAADVEHLLTVRSLITDKSHFHSSYILHCTACFREPHDAEGGTPPETTKTVPYGGIYRDMLTLLRENGLQKILPCAYLRLSKQTTLFLGNGSGPTELSARCPSLITVCTMENGQHPGLDHPMETCRRLRGQVLLPETHKGILRHVPPQTVRDSLCDACAALAETAITTGRAKMWENLPSELKNSNEM